MGTEFLCGMMKKFQKGKIVMVAQQYDLMPLSFTLKNGQKVNFVMVILSLYIYYSKSFDYSPIVTFEIILMIYVHDFKWTTMKQIIPQRLAVYQFRKKTTFCGLFVLGNK